MASLVIHQTDLYHPHLDSDDYWDLACQYALHYHKEIHLAGVVMDHVPKIRLNHGDPSVIAVNQMNYITGSHVGIAIGTNNKFSSFQIENYHQNNQQFAAVKLIEDTLLNSHEKVTIQIVGSCKDVAIAIKVFPELFKEKCAAIYLNAGVSNPESKTEYNVSLDPLAFETVFHAPCPVYWLPSHRNFVEPYQVEQFATYYCFQQDDILPFLSHEMQNYFVYGLVGMNDLNWLTYLSKRKQDKLYQNIGNEKRNMWSTAGILAAAGKTVTKEGKIVEVGQAMKDPVFEFKSMKATCNHFGRVDWEFTTEATEKYLFVINDLEIYESCMIQAMRELLASLP